MERINKIVDGVQLNLLVADSFLSRMRGLSFRKGIDCDGMLLRFPFRWRWSVWMVGVRFSIRLIWMNRGRVVDIEERIPQPSTLREAFTPHSPSTQVDELIEVIVAV